MEDSLFVFVIVEHLDIDSQGIVEVVVVSWSSIEELSKQSDNLGEDIRLRRVDARTESLDNSFTLDCDLGLGCVRRSRRSLLAMEWSALSVPAVC